MHIWQVIYLFLDENCLTQLIFVCVMYLDFKLYIIYKHFRSPIERRIDRRELYDRWVQKYGERCVQRT